MTTFPSERLSETERGALERLLGDVSLEEAARVADRVRELARDRDEAVWRAVHASEPFAA
jgi:hypothetical protein